MAEMKITHEGIPLPRPKVSRNEPCPCGSGAKFKNCCKTEDNMLQKAYAAANELKRQQEQAETM